MLTASQIEQQLRRQFKTPQQVKRQVLEPLLRLIPPTQQIKDGQLVPRLNKYIPWQPTAKQVQFLSSAEKDVFYGGAAGGGKLLSLNTFIPTPGGWTTMGEVRVGDQVFDESGRPCNVVWTSDIEQEDTYKIIFSDGTEVIAGARHQWVTSTYLERARVLHHTKEWRARREQGRGSRAGVRDPNAWARSSGHKSALFTKVLTERNKQHPPPLKAIYSGVRTTEEIRATLRDCSGSLNHTISLAKPLELPEADLLIDPYVLGVWLGDGISVGGYISGIDEEIFSQVANAGYVVTRHKDPTSRGVLGLARQLRQLGVWGNKHIPAAYLRASKQQRLALLQGLADTDGNCNDGPVEIGFSRKQLVDDVHELILSLGIKCTVRERSSYYGRGEARKYCGPCWDMKFLTDLPAFRLPRKLIRQKQAGFRGNHSRRYVIDVLPVEREPLRCIQVDSPSHCYLVTRSMIPTHNSIALLMAAAQFADVPGYKALIIRKTFAQLKKPGALMYRAHEWWGNMPGVTRKDGGEGYEFETGGTPSILAFGHMENSDSRRNYQSAEYACICLDEVTDFAEADFQFMFSRLRQPPPGVPLRMRSGSNPNGPGRLWVKQRYVDPTTNAGRGYIPAQVDDNEYLYNKDEYKEQLARELGPVEAAQLLKGDWEAAAAGKFRRHWFKIINAVPGNARYVRYWDLAATEDRGDNDPSYTAGVLMGHHGRDYYIADVRRGRLTPKGVEDLVLQTTQLDRQTYGHVAVRMEQEPGSAGVNVISHYTKLLAGYDFKGDKVTGPREIRANALASQAEAGNVYLVAGQWNRSMLDEFDVFPGGGHDDQVTAASGAFNEITGVPPVNTKSIVMFGERLEFDW